MWIGRRRRKGCQLKKKKHTGHMLSETKELTWVFSIFYLATLQVRDGEVGRRRMDPRSWKMVGSVCRQGTDVVGRKRIRSRPCSPWRQQGAKERRGGPSTLGAEAALLSGYLHLPQLSTTLHRPCGQGGTATRTGGQG